MEDKKIDERTDYFFSFFSFMAEEAARETGHYFYMFPAKEDVKKALWDSVDKDGFNLFDHILWDKVDKDGFKFIYNIPLEYQGEYMKKYFIIRFKNGSTINLAWFDKKTKID